MEPITFIKTLISVVKTTQTIRDFLKEDVKSVLSAIGDNHFHAALRALEDRERSAHADREIIMAITHLRGAYEAYQNSMWAKGQMKAYQAACLIAVCYRYLYIVGNEDRLDLAQNWLNWANERFGAYQRDMWNSYERLRPRIGNSSLIGFFVFLVHPASRYPERLEKEKEAHEQFVAQWNN